MQSVDIVTLRTEDQFEFQSFIFKIVTYVTIYLIPYRFYTSLQHAVKQETISNSHSKIKEKSKNRRSPGKARDPSTTEDPGRELSGGDSLGISTTLLLGGD